MNQRKKQHHVLHGERTLDDVCDNLEHLIQVVKAVTVQSPSLHGPIAPLALQQGEEEQEDGLAAASQTKGVSTPLALGAEVPPADGNQDEPEENGDPWKAVFAKVPGQRHLTDKRMVPCQDASYAQGGDYAIVLDADGAGSAMKSEKGSQALVNSTRVSLELIRSDLIDLLGREKLEDGQLERLAESFLRSLDLSLRIESESLGIPIKEIRTTFCCALVGKKQCIWLSVGDGTLAVEKEGSLELIHHGGHLERPNVTEFVSGETPMEHLSFGAFPSAGVKGVVAFSDGLDSRMVSQDRKRVAPKILELFKELRDEELEGEDLARFLLDAELWQRERDDRSMALIAR